MPDVLVQGVGLDKFSIDCQTRIFLETLCNPSALSDHHDPHIIIKATEPLLRETGEPSMWQDICPKLALAHSQSL